MGRNWTRNLRLKIGAVVAAVAGTLGFYGLIQAHPVGSQTTNSVATATVSGVSNRDVSSQPVQRASQRTIPRQRVSRGS